MIEIINLKKSFDSLTVLDNINLKIAAGDIFGLVGKSGAGKSTLLRCINGLEQYDDGKLYVDETEIASLPKNTLRHFRKNIGMIFQNFALLERRTVYENIALPMKAWGLDKKTIDRRVNELLKLIGIPEKIWDRPSTLSGGQKQRVGIARALSLNPKILLCDEATSALDPKTTQSILALLRQINEQLGLTIVVVTHQMSVVRQVCNKIAILEGGQISETDTVENMLLEQPPAFSEFVGTSNPVTTSGINIRLFLPADIATTGVLSSIIRTLDMDIPIIAGQIEQCQDKVLGNFVLNVPSDGLEKVITVLRQKGVKWKIISDNQ